MVNINTNKETGRSMVEMLGTLAIIGVLSIGGIAGYTIAMNKHRANELLDGASKRAIVVMQQLSLGATASDVNLGEFSGSNNTGSGIFSETVLDVDVGEFGIEVTDVEQAVCEVLAGMSAGDVEIMMLDGGEVFDFEPDDCSSTKAENDLAFVYKSNGGSADFGDDANCWQRGDCREDDEEGDDAFCDGEMHVWDYCSCRNYGGSTAECKEWASFEDDYIACRKSGKSGYFCGCKYVSYQESDTVCSIYDSCMKSDKSLACCECIMMNNEEICMDPCE